MISLKMNGLHLCADPLLPWTGDKYSRNGSELPHHQGLMGVGETGWDISRVGSSPGWWPGSMDKSHL